MICIEQFVSDNQWRNGRGQI